ncbi:MAG: acetate--CoA ligase family protein [Sedimentisphaerales bacterium]|nr:acetate--CoA ligase family protein [Sedimentisphaerales bacterium]
MNLKSFFNPQSIAIVGASRQKGKVGYEILTNLIAAGYKGKIFPINPNADIIEGLKCYPDLESIGRIPELVIIVVPAKFVPDVMQQCAKVKAKSVIIITAGFKEVGKEGKLLEEQIIQIAKQAGIRVIGPNCLGVIAPVNKLNASFGGDLPAEGVIGYVSQSGALLAAILDMANAQGIGFSKLISIGNKADIDELDVIKALGEDPDTKVIAGYLESITSGNEFVRQAERISHDKPILLIKSGISAAGARAASSHTGSLAGGEAAYESAFARAGIIRCSSIKRQFDYAQAMAFQPLPAGASIAVVTNAGGPGIMAADAIEANDLTFAKLTDETIKQLSANLPPASNLYNPIDILGDALADRYKLALDIVYEDPNVDIILVLLTPQAMTEPTESARAIVKIAHKNQGKPVLACFLGAKKVEEGLKILRDGKIPCYDSLDRAVATIKVMTDYVRWRNRPKRVVKLFPVNRRKVENIIERHLRRGDLPARSPSDGSAFSAEVATKAGLWRADVSAKAGRELGETDSKDILQAYGFKTPEGSVANTPEQAVNIAEQIGFPVVLKIWSSEIVHKSDVGGVKLGLNSAEAVRDAFALMMYRIPKKQPDANILGVLVEKMYKLGKEVILGMNRDPHFGPLMMFGMGGIMVEVLKDVSFYLAPLTAEEAKEMLISTKTYQILKGVRGQEGVDIDAIAEGLQRLSQLVTEFPQIQEMDINPYMVGPPGTTPIAVDARMSVKQG